jgi:hypothetical protein
MSSSSESEAVLSGIVKGADSGASAPHAGGGATGSPPAVDAAAVDAAAVDAAAVDAAANDEAAEDQAAEDQAGAPDGAVNYDEAGLVEVELDQVLYRLDAGKQGTALCISTRSGDSWRWRFHGEARWDGRTLRSKAFDRRLLDRLSKELQQAASAE